VHVNGENYVINDSDKRYEPPGAGEDITEHFMPKASSLAYMTSGYGEFIGKRLIYDEYAKADGTRIRFYVDGGKWVGMKILYSGIPRDYTISNFNANPPDDVFKIPSDYEVV